MKTFKLLASNLRSIDPEHFVMCSTGRQQRPARDTGMVRGAVLALAPAAGRAARGRRPALPGQGRQAPDLWRGLESLS